jgi:hypothetical protein
LIVIEEGEKNIGDLKLIKVALYNEGIKSMRVTFKQIHSESWADGEGRLFMRG